MGCSEAVLRSGQVELGRPGTLRTDWVLIPAGSPCCGQLHAYSNTTEGSGCERANAPIRLKIAPLLLSLVRRHSYKKMEMYTGFFLRKIYINNKKL